MYNINFFLDAVPELYNLFFGALGNQTHCVCKSQLRFYTDVLYLKNTVDMMNLEWRYERHRRQSFNSTLVNVGVKLGSC